MRWLRWLGLGLLAAGVALLAASVGTGQGQVSLFLIMPVFWGTGLLGFLAVATLVLGLAILVFGPVLSSVPIGASSLSAPSPDSPASGAVPPPSPEYGGVVVVGPFPIAFGSDRAIATWMFIVGLAIAIGFLILTLLWMDSAFLHPSP